MPVRPQDSVDILERVLTKGAKVERADEEAGGEPEEQDNGPRRVSIAGVGLLNVHTDLSWRSLDEPDERSLTAE